MTGTTGHGLGAVVGVVARGQTYRNLLYLLLAFPLGLCYYVLLTAGLALGVGLSVLLVGLGILFGTLLLARLLATVERHLADRLLGTDLVATASSPDTSGAPAETAVAYLRAASTWTDLGFLLVKFWVGVAAFTLLVTLLGTALELLLMPVAPGALGVQVGSVEVAELVDTRRERAAGVAVGLVLAVASLHAVNAFAGVTRRVAVAMLS